jgi:hypothetical protein
MVLRVYKLVRLLDGGTPMKVTKGDVMRAIVVGPIGMVAAVSIVGLITKRFPFFVVEALGGGIGWVVGVMGCTLPE